MTAPYTEEPTRALLPTTPVQKLNPRLANISQIRYTPRLIHLLMSTASHGVMVIMGEIREQEKLRADPRFPLMQTMQRHKRYQAIFSGPTGKPIFA